MTTRTRSTTQRGSGAIEAHQFQLLVASVKDYAIFMLDPAGHVTSWNAGAQQIKGYRADEVIGKHMSIFYPPEEVARGGPRALLDAALAQGRVEDEGWRVRKDGSHFWADVVITALRDSNGTLQGFGKVTRDLTARKEAEEKLRQSEEDLGNDSLQHRRCGARRRRERAGHAHQPRRRAPDRMVGEGSDRPPDRRGLQHHQRGDAAPRRQNPVSRVLAEGVVVGLANHTALIARDGTERPIADSGAPIRDARGATRGAVLVFRDVTDERRAEEALRRSEESLSATLYSIGDGVLATDAHGRITRINPVAERLTGWSEKEAIGRPIDEVFNIVNEDTRAKAPNPVSRVLAEGVVVGPRQSHRAHLPRRHRTAHRGQRRAHPRHRGATRAVPCSSSET